MMLHTEKPPRSVVKSDLFGIFVWSCITRNDAGQLYPPLANQTYTSPTTEIRIILRNTTSATMHLGRVILMFPPTPD